MFINNSYNNFFQNNYNPNLRTLNTLADTIRSVCKIKYKYNGKLIYGTGFFIKFERENNNPLNCLMTCEHVIYKQLVQLKMCIEIWYDNQHCHKIIKLDNRFIKEFTFLNIDALVIEIFPSLDQIQEELFLQPYVDYNDNYSQFKNKLVKIVQFPEGENLCYSDGQIVGVNEFSYNFCYKTNTKNGSSGSPIFLKGSKYVLGIHKQVDDVLNIRFANFLKPIIDSIKYNFNYGKEIYHNRIYEGEFINDIKDGRGKIIFEDQGFFYGYWKDYKMDGKGSMFYKNKSLQFEGYFSKNLPEGQGKFIDKKGNYFIGEFIGGYKFGKGKEFTKDNVLKYDGNFEYGKYQGIGKYNIGGGFFYLGNFEKGAMRGEGQIYRNNILIFKGIFSKSFISNIIFMNLGENYYIGEFKNNKIEGRGIIFNNNNSIIYQGEFINSQKSGKGILYYNNGCYKGEFKNNLKHGKGKEYDNNNNCIFEGNFINGKREGEGILKNDNSYYIGTFKDGNFHGKGILKIGNDYEYDGEFVNDQKEGKGKLTTNEFVYNGYFKNNEMNGEGKIYNNITGTNLCGNFVNGKMQGEGKIFDKNNNLIYEGNFVNGKKEGDNEKYIYENGSYYLGQFRNNEMHGNGIIYNKDNEEKYEGEFEHDKKNGQGTYYLKGKELYYKGQFKDDDFNGRGIIFENGIKRYEGNFKNNRFDGKGKLFDKDGNFRMVELNGDEIREGTFYIKDIGVMEFADKLAKACNIF